MTPNLTTDTARADASGVYLMVLTLTWSSNDADQRAARFQANGVTVRTTHQDRLASTGRDYETVSLVDNFAASTLLSADVWQSSNTTIYVESAELAIVHVAQSKYAKLHAGPHAIASGYGWHSLGWTAQSDPNTLFVPGLNAHCVRIDYNQGVEYPGWYLVSALVKWSSSSSGHRELRLNRWLDTGGQDESITLTFAGNPGNNYTHLLYLHYLDTEFCYGPLVASDGTDVDEAWFTVARVEAPGAVCSTKDLDAMSIADETYTYVGFQEGSLAGAQHCSPAAYWDGAIGAFRMQSSGWYLALEYANWDNNDDDQRLIAFEAAGLRRNDLDRNADVAGGSGDERMQNAVLVWLNTGNTLRYQAWQSSNSSRSLDSNQYKLLKLEP